MPSVPEIIKEIDRKQISTISRKAASGSVRALELLWANLLMEHHNFWVVPAWTERQRGECRDFARRFGAAHEKALMEFSVKNWSRARTLFPALPPKPVFSSMYAWRDKFMAMYTEEQDRLEKEQREKKRRIMEEAEARATKPEKSLSEMVLEARKNKSVGRKKQDAVGGTE